MINCHHCGKSNLEQSNFCRYCGSKFGHQAPVQSNFPVPQRKPDNSQFQQPEPGTISAPRPYSWKTDEYEVSRQDARQTRQIQESALQQYQNADHVTRPLVPAKQNNQAHLMRGYRCPRCASTSLPYKEKRISTAGWITFAALMVTLFPLFWIGFFLKEEVLVCPVCNFKMVH